MLKEGSHTHALRYWTKGEENFTAGVYVPQVTIIHNFFTSFFFLFLFVCSAISNGWNKNCKKKMRCIRNAKNYEGLWAHSHIIRKWMQRKSNGKHNFNNLINGIFCLTVRICQCIQWSANTSVTCNVMIWNLLFCLKLWIFAKKK